MYAIHSSRVAGRVELPDIPFVDVQSGEPPIGGALSEHATGVGIPFNGKHWRMAEDEIGE